MYLNLKKYLIYDLASNYSLIFGFTSNYFLKIKMNNSLNLTLNY